MLNVVGIKFSVISMPRYYTDTKIIMQEGCFCVCPVDDREEIGYVASREYRCEKAVKNGNYPEVIRKASEEEISQWNEQKDRERKTIEICKEKAIKHNLQIKVTDVCFDNKNNKIIFHFTSDKRVDFRELVRDLAGTLRSRIELWQIGVRDEARKIDGLGICGNRLCCASFLKNFQPVTIRLAKNQDIFLSPNKLSGCCGRLMCCLAFEEEQYRNIAETSYAIGSRVKTNDVSGVIIERNLLCRTYIIKEANDNKVTVKHEEIISEENPAKASKPKQDEKEETRDDV
jgi:cell fate regulator YaaT (PSP1 superfamily)